MRLVEVMRMMQLRMVVTTTGRDCDNKLSKMRFVGGLQRENHELKAQLELFSNRVDCHFTTLHCNIQWISVQPAHPVGRNA
jgi:hypothetical protein